ncbi:MAG: hypothetical protein II298_01985 [Bacteroidales bacterium]|nr:hypothetical protein [Bacteroidales bacterium]
MGLNFRKLGVFLRKARLDFSKSGIEISKSRIEKIKSRFFLKKSKKKLQKTAKNLAKSKTFLAFLGLQKVKSLILCFLVKGLFFQNLQLEILKLKISQAFGLNSWGKFFIFSFHQRH